MIAPRLGLQHPVSTSIPAAAGFDPRARRSRVGIARRHHDTRDARAHQRPLQGGVWPVWLQGSSVT
jgi:alkanesulfonate monooxygenase SsuD/methylene tetrahydromethanopterin reductase-like flavin-dependent oxidoreductase (luciferase family)